MKFISIELLHEKIRECRLCADESFPISLPPIASGNAPAPFMVIGQAPSLTDLRVRETYSGPAGLKLRSWFTEAGFADGDWGTNIYAAALTKCFPGRLPGKSTDRAPSMRERALCRPWLDREIEIVDPSVIVLFGKLAIDTFLGTGALTERIGQAFNSDNKVYVPLPHSSGASTWLNIAEHRKLLGQAIERISEQRIRVMGTAVNRSGLP